MKLGEKLGGPETIALAATGALIGVCEVGYISAKDFAKRKWMERQAKRSKESVLGHIALEVNENIPNLRLAEPISEVQPRPDELEENTRILTHAA